jgi:hypothetical protein
MRLFSLRRWSAPNAMNGPTTSIAALRRQLTHPQNVLKKREKVNMTPEMIKAFMEPLALIAVFGIAVWAMVIFVRME